MYIVSKKKSDITFAVCVILLFKYVKLPECVNYVMQAHT